MFRVLLIIVLLAGLWLLSLKLTRRQAAVAGGLGLSGFVINGWRASAQGLSFAEVFNYNFSNIPLLLVNLLSGMLCLLGIMVLVRLWDERH